MAQLERHPSAYRTSFALEEVDAVLKDGRRLALVLKSLDWNDLREGVQRIKPDFLHDPQRELEAYKQLVNAGLGAAQVVASGRGWLLLERVQGVRLSQVGELESWRAAARWLVRMHDRFAAAPPRSQHLLDRDANFYRLWIRRALEFSRAEVKPIATRYEQVIERLLSLPQTFVHGEFYGSNVIVSDDGHRISAIDWELAGVGPGLLDLAALIAGWDESEGFQIMQAYGRVDSEELDCCRLHMALQWLGWARNWTPPPEHTHDWLADAHAAAGRLGLL